jgi:glutamate dehydrogenase
MRSAGKDDRVAGEILTAILKAPVDLMWFGGIGTYVRARDEANGDVGDKANDAIRITGRELRAKVVGEGANLGMTQKARIEYGNGGRCNSDAIDNSAGVNSSDVEVNIKIPLAAAMRKDGLTRDKRNKLLSDMTEEVARLVLSNNYRQTLAISLSADRGAAILVTRNASWRPRTARPARSRGRAVAFFAGDGRTTEGRPVPDACRNRRAARLCQDRAV